MMSYFILMVSTRGVQKVHRLILMDIVNFIDIVSLVNTVCCYSIAQLLLGCVSLLHVCRCGLLLQTE